MLKEGDERKVKAAGPTTSSREEPYQADVIRRYGVRAMIGKVGMGKKTSAASQEWGAVYLNVIGGAAQYYGRTVEKVVGVHLSPLQDGHLLAKGEDFDSEISAASEKDAGGARGALEEKSRTPTLLRPCCYHYCHPRWPSSRPRIGPLRCLALQPLAHPRRRVCRFVGSTNRQNGGRPTLPRRSYCRQVRPQGPWLHTPPERVYTQAAPASAWSKGPPTRAVFPSAESATE
jgi:hypothetical protein